MRLLLHNVTVANVVLQDERGEESKSLEQIFLEVILVDEDKTNPDPGQLEH